MKKVYFALALSMFLDMAGFSAAVASEKTKLALNWKPEPQFGGFYAAEKLGLFKKYQIEVEILQGGAGTPVVQMLAAGSVDFGIVSVDELVISRSKGSDLVALFAVYQKNPQVILTHESRGFKTLREIYQSDGVLALQAGLPYAQFLSKKYKEVKVKLVPYQGGITGLISSHNGDKKFAQQGFATSEPLAAARAGIKTSVFLIADEGYNPYTTVLAAKKSLVDKKPSLVAAMVHSVRAGWEAYLTSSQEINTYMHEKNRSMDIETFHKSALAQIPLIRPLQNSQQKAAGNERIGAMTEKRWQELVDQLYDLAVIQNKPSQLFVEVK